MLPLECDSEAYKARVFSFYSESCMTEETEHKLNLRHLTLD